MRIVKAQTIALLKSENAQLKAQEAQCWRQVQKFEGINFGAMSGMGIAAAQQKLRMQAAIAMAHLAFYESLMSANATNMGLVHALPETSAGVLDTSVARRGMEEALRKVRALQAQMESSLAEIKRKNDSLYAQFVTCADPGMTWHPIDENPVRNFYRSLIDAQRKVAHANEAILRHASDYDRQSLAVYKGVNTSFMQQAHASGSTYHFGGGWGDTSWVMSLEAFAAAGGIGKPPKEHTPTKSLAERFLDGDLKETTAALSGKGDVRGSVFGIPAFAAVSGSLLGATLLAKPFAKDSAKQDEDEDKQHSSSLGAKAELELYAAKGKAQAGFGLLGADTQLKLLSGTATGSLGAALAGEGELLPSLEAGGKLEGTVLASETNASVGTEDLDLHVQVHGKALTASTEAKLQAGLQGVEARVGAEAYAVTGGITYGCTLLGVKVDTAVEGKVAGGGAKAGGKVDVASAEGELGLGLGVGLGVKVKVDWSGLGKGVEDARRCLDAWWGTTFASKAA